MRKGRFAALGEKGEVTPPSLAELLLFDVTRQAEEGGARIAAERARSVGFGTALLGVCHLLWGAALATAVQLSAGLPALLPLLALLLAVLLLDFALWRVMRTPSLAPFRAMRLAGGHAFLTGALWIGAAAWLSTGPAGESVLVRAALVAGASAGIPILFLVPPLMMLTCAMTLGVVAVLRSEAPLAAIAAATAAFLVALGIARSRQLLFSARERLALEWQAKKAERFVADFEASGRGWFWETSADGALTYVSEALAAHLGFSRGELEGRRFDEVLLVDSAGEARRTLGFHLSARFPFNDLIVRAPAAADSWWSLSGTPNFDDYGRFLGFRGIGTDLSRERRTEAETTKLARYDSLTGLPNRAMMRTMLDEALANAAARRRGCALMLVDLDKFKRVNDTYGHPVGDKLLKQVAKRLRTVLGEEGQAGRLGGDEFEAILPGVEEQGRLADIAGKLIEEVSRPYRIEGQEMRIGASVGIAVAVPGKSLAEGLIKEADLALYAAKGAGRGTSRFFQPEMHAEATERQILESDLRGALATDQLKLLYQPIVDSVSEEVVAFEALIRWHHPTRGLLAPALLVPLAEESGLMPRIGEWVLRTACAEAAKWPAHIRIAVNLSPLQFADPALATAVAGSLAASDLDPDRLELEINEAVFLADQAVTDQTLARLRGLGVRLALDNFGTGRSGLGHLRDAPLDKIKIDRSFVRGAAAPRSRNGAIVRAIAVLAESLGIDTTAEGVETLEELALIRRLGCSQVQGFLFGKPVPAADALVLASESKPTGEVLGFTRPPRHRLIRMGSLSVDGQILPVRLRNISAGGAMIECERELVPGMDVELDLDEAGRLEAEVRWCQRGQAGLQFAQPFELRKLARTKPGAGGLKMLTPSYLGANAEAAASARSPLAAKRAGR
jgi:diguanylate cyclase (GGDEF)-like protein/PAS domain S-box-containing protein